MLGTIGGVGVLDIRSLGEGLVTGRGVALAWGWLTGKGVVFCCFGVVHGMGWGDFRLFFWVQSKVVSDAQNSHFCKVLEMIGRQLYP